MKLNLKNFCKISKAEIKIDGITVIAGKNNTGKSTIGKTLFSYFNSFFEIRKKIDSVKHNNIVDLLDQKLEIFARSNSDFKYTLNHHRFIRWFVNDFMKDDSNDFIGTNITDIDTMRKKDQFEIACRRYGIKGLDYNYILSLYKPIKIETDNFDNQKICMDIVDKRFNYIFKKQICNFNSNLTAELSLTIKNKTSSISFTSNKINKFDYTSFTDLEHDAILIDDPNILNTIYRPFYNYIENERFGIDLNRLELHQKKLIDLFNLSLNNNDTTIKSIKAKEKMNELLKIINCVTDGQLIVQDDHTLAYLEGKNKSPTSILNLSLGLKPFVLIKHFIEKEIIKEKDVLILDEPEVHLHPEWQIHFAEIIVLLQKIYNLSIILTTHSADFVEAIELYSRKYNIDDLCNYYVSKEKNNEIIFNDFNSNPTEIYRQLIDPEDKLDSLRTEIEEKSNA